MNKTTTGLIIISTITAVIGGALLNFNELLMGSQPTVKNSIVTFTYLAIWILALRIGINNKNPGLIRYCSVFWLITLIFSIFTGYVNVIEVNADWAIPFVILFLGQFYGIKFLTVSNMNTAIAMSFISLIIFTTAMISLKRIKSGKRLTDSLKR